VTAPRHRLTIALSALILLAVGSGAAAAAPSNTLIKAAEVGYFGSAAVTHTVSVFVYSSLGPAAGNRITVCLADGARQSHLQVSRDLLCMHNDGSTPQH
jgi:hypothetical protein